MPLPPSKSRGALGRGWQGHKETHRAVAETETSPRQPHHPEASCHEQKETLGQEMAASVCPSMAAFESGEGEQLVMPQKWPI